MYELDHPAKAMIVWDKVNPAQHLDLYFKQHEIIFYHGPFGGNKTVRGDVWQLKRQKNTVHPTMKPIELIELALQDHPTRKIVYDAFGGSGSTLIACEKTGRVSRIMELDPKYCDVIVKRWQDFIGKKATLESTGQLFDEVGNNRG
jgi:DNA modification methylase